MSGRARGFVLAVALVVVGAACAPDGDLGGAPASTPDGVTACEVTDIGGIEGAFNAVVWQGLRRARRQLDVSVQLLESHQQADYEPNIRAMVERDCDLIVTVGFRLSDATRAAARAQPGRDYAIVDFAFDPPLENVLGQSFASDQAAFLAGYLAAGMTRSGAVGAFGSVNIPTVTVYLDGFARGVAYHNQRKGGDVRMLGWDPDNQEGLFTGDVDDDEGARTLTERLIGQGADVIFPVAGAATVGAARAADEALDVRLIGSETDGCVSHADFCHLFITSVLKRADVSVFEAVRAVVDGSFEGGTYVGTLRNRGVDIAPYHEAAPAVPAALKAEIDELREAIIDDRIVLPA